MKLYSKDGIVLAWHDDLQDVPASSYGEGVVILVAPAGYEPEVGAEAPEDAEAAPIRVYKADIWRRSTDEEAEIIDAALSAQPVRLRNLFRDAAFLSSDDELYEPLRSAFVSAFGQARAVELLAAS